jgi:sialidase-1
MRSDDDGISFGPPREITDVVAGYRQKGVDWQLVGNGCGHGIQLASGRLVEALWLSHPTGLGNGGPRHSWWYPANVGVLYSDDHGGTWKIGDWVIRASAEFPHPNETCEVELADGRVLFNTRVEGPFYRRAVTTTADVAGRWDPPRYDQGLFDPHCEGSILRLSVKGAHTRNRILFCNPDSKDSSRDAPGGIGGQSRPRRNLTVRLSYDECRTWPVSKVIDSGIAGYSDLTLLPDGTLFCIYERGSTNGSQTANAALTLFRFDLRWLTGGRDDGG